MERTPGPELLQYIAPLAALPLDATNLEMLERLMDAKLAIQESNARMRQLRKLYGLTK